MINIVYICVEYSPIEKRVMVRGVFNDKYLCPKPLHPDNKQNIVSCFADTDMGKHVGFAGLIPEL